MMDRILECTETRQDLRLVITESGSIGIVGHPPEYIVAEVYDFQPDQAARPVIVFPGGQQLHGIIRRLAALQGFLVLNQEKPKAMADLEQNKAIPVKESVRSNVIESSR